MPLEYALPIDVVTVMDFMAGIGMIFGGLVAGAFGDRIRSMRFVLGAATERIGIRTTFLICGAISSLVVLPCFFSPAITRLYREARPSISRFPT